MPGDGGVAPYLPNPRRANPRMDGGENLGDPERVQGRWGEEEGVWGTGSQSHTAIDALMVTVHAASCRRRSIRSSEHLETWVRSKKPPIQRSRDNKSKSIEIRRPPPSTITEARNKRKGVKAQVPGNTSSRDRSGGDRTITWPRRLPRTQTAKRDKETLEFKSALGGR
jgi:hypothetical protein